MKCNKLKVYYIVFVGLLLAAFVEFIVYINLCTNKIELGNNKGLEYINYITQTMEHKRAKGIRYKIRIY